MARAPSNFNIRPSDPDSAPTPERPGEVRSGYESETFSVSSSVFEYTYENGRRYHAYQAGNYVMPNDETEQNRLDIMHHVYSLMLGGKLFEAPLKMPQRILDVGTGTGIWAIEVADHFHSAQVIGIDLSPIQPRWVPDNVHFLVDDAEAEWTYTGTLFDFIHVRGLSGSLTDWSRFLGQAFEYTRPGGYIELFELPRFEMDCDDGTYEGSALQRFCSLVEKASIQSGRPFTVDPNRPLDFLLKEAGFENPQIKIITMPLGLWPQDKLQKEFGHWAQVAMETGFEAYGMALLTRVLGMTIQDVGELVAQCLEELESQTVHCYCSMHNIVARKPL